MRFYITTPDHLKFWNGYGFSNEYPDAKLYDRRSEAKAGLQIAQSRTIASLVIIDIKDDN